MKLGGQIRPKTSFGYTLMVFVVHRLLFENIFLVFSGKFIENMSKTKICILCDGEFDPRSAEKIKAGGKINHCPDCSEESEPRVLGLTSGDGKMAAINIVRCASKEEAERLKQYWRKATGLNKGKQCQMHNPGLTMPQVSFDIISKSGSMNHKGKE